MASLLSLASVIAKESTRIADFIESNELPNPSFDASGPPALPIPPGNHELVSSQQKLYAAAQDLAILSIGAVEHLRWQAFEVCRPFPFCER